MDKFFDIVLDVEVDYVRFLGKDLVVVTYKDKSEGVLKLDNHGWGWSDTSNGCPGDVAARDTL